RAGRQGAVDARHAGKACAYTGGPLLRAARARRHSVDAVRRRARGSAELVAARVTGFTQSSLSDAELAEVLNWSLRAFSDTAPAGSFAPFSSQEISVARTQP